LSKIYGVFTIRVPAMEELTCFIMENMLGKDFMSIERIYDLKGSTKGRLAKLSAAEESEGTGMKVLKDLNLVSLGERLEIGEAARRKLLRAIELDSQFLQRNNLMDYSLLLIKARNDRKLSVVEHEMMPALVLLREQNGEARLELRNSISIVKPGRTDHQEEKKDLARIEVLFEDQNEEELEIVLRTDGARSSSAKRLSTVKEKTLENSMDTDAERFERNLRKFESDEAEIQQRIRIAQGDL